MFKKFFHNVFIFFLKAPLYMYISSFFVPKYKFTLLFINLMMELIISKNWAHFSQRRASEGWFSSRQFPWTSTAPRGQSTVFCIWRARIPWNEVWLPLRKLGNQLLNHLWPNQAWENETMSLEPSWALHRRPGRGWGDCDIQVLPRGWGNRCWGVNQV